MPADFQFDPLAFVPGIIADGHNNGVIFQGFNFKIKKTSRVMIKLKLTTVSISFKKSGFHIFSVVIIGLVPENYGALFGINHLISRQSNIIRAPAQISKRNGVAVAAGNERNIADNFG